MSLKYNDQDFITEFIKITDLIKNAQITPTKEQFAPQVVDSYSQERQEKPEITLAKKLIDQLILGPSVNAGPTSTVAPELFIKDLTNLHSLINFLHDQKIQFGGQYIVSNVKDDKRLPFNVDAAALGDLGTGQVQGMPGGSQTVYIDKDALIAYLKDLQTKSKDNPIMGTMTDKLIDEANTQLTLKMDKVDSKTQTQDTKSDSKAQIQEDIPDTTVVDNISSEIATNKPLENTKGEGNVLTIGDLRSQQSLVNWVKKRSLQFGGVDGQKEIRTVEDFCNLAKYLNARSKALNVSGTKEFKLYQQLTGALVTAYCGGSDETNSNQNSNYQQTSYETTNLREGKLSPEQLKTLESIGLFYPLKNGVIDFFAIKKWLTLYNKIMGQNAIGAANAGTVNSALQLVDQFITAPPEGYGLTNQTLTVSPQSLYSDIYGRLTKPLAPKEYLISLDSLLSDMDHILNSFQSTIGPSMPQDWQEKLTQQIEEILPNNNSRLSQLQQGVDALMTNNAKGR